MYENGCLTFDNAIQRGFVWDKRRSSLLIDTILRDMIIPPIYVVKTENKIKTKNGMASIYDVIDGKQRCLTTAKFRSNGFALTGIETPVTLSDGSTFNLNDLTYDELPDELKEAFDRFSFSICMIIDASDEDIVEVMARLNNGKALSTVENTRIKAKDLTGIQRFSNLDFFKNHMTEKSINGYHNEDIVVKMCILLDNMNTDAVSLDNADVRSVFENLVITGNKTRNDELETIISTMSDIVNTMLEDKKKAAAKRFVSKTGLLSSVRTIKTALDDGYDSEYLAEFFEDFFSKTPSSNDDYNNAAKSGTNHSINVGAREVAMRDAFNAFTPAASSDDE
jgi:hypothetical protein